MSLKKSIDEIQKKYGVVGRRDEIAALIHCLSAGKHVLLEGPVGVGKTHLVSAVSAHVGRKVVRVDGDTRYTEQKLSGWFDPPTVLKKGYKKDSYFDGPLSDAMRTGSLLFVNELNRMPEGVQNILLPALDEYRIEIPRIGQLKAKPGFSVVATMNPREFVATTHISEALLDRFELVLLNYQPREEEREILMLATSYSKKGAKNDKLIDWALDVVRGSRENTMFKRGASIRAGISIYDIAQGMGGEWEHFEKACQMALPTRLELSDEGIEAGMAESVRKLTEDAKKKLTQEIRFQDDKESPEWPTLDTVAFIAPDAFADLGDTTVEAVSSDIGWRNAITFHEKLRRIQDPILKEKVQASAVRAILQKAQSALGSISRPYKTVNAPWEQNLSQELDLDASLEEDPSLNELLVEIREESRAEVVVCLDTSLSMTGRKLALLGVSVATMALQLKPEDLCVINFESEAHLVKELGDYMTPHRIVEKFIHSPAKGLTNMEAALKLAIQQCNRGKLPKRHVILMSDGRFTAGARPEYLIPRLPKLHVVQTGSPWSNNRFFKRMARIGDGKFVQAKDFEDLPRALYSLVHEILR